jgi:GntR family transcriptional regulator
MIIKIDMSKDTAIYKQIYDEIVKGILVRDVETNESLPSVRNMAASLSVNMHTVSKAYAKLKHEGFISLQRNNRATINDKESYAYSEEYVMAISDELEKIVIEAKCRGLKEKDLTEIIIKNYKKY